MPHLASSCRNEFQKGSITVVYVEVVILKKIIPHVDVRVPVGVQITDSEPESITGFTLENTRFRTHICKKTIVVSKETVSGEAVRDKALIALAIGPVRMDRMIQEVEIEIPIEVVIKKCRLCR